MSEEEKPEEKPKEEPKKEEVKPLPDLDKITPKHLSDLESKLRDEIEERHAGDKQEREELKAQLKVLEEYKEEQEKAQGERDKVKGSESTLVLPPNDLPPQQPNPNPETKGEPGADGKKQSFWKRVW